jgi:energy-converting hydrogenase Eha subunit A
MVIVISHVLKAFLIFIINSNILKLPSTHENLPLDSAQRKLLLPNCVKILGHYFISLDYVVNNATLISVELPL